MMISDDVLKTLIQTVGGVAGTAVLQYFITRRSAKKTLHHIDKSNRDAVEETVEKVKDKVEETVRKTMAIRASQMGVVAIEPEVLAKHGEVDARL